MKPYLVVIATALFLPILLRPALAGRCEGSASCSVCTNCSRCAYCGGGGTCGVCAGTSRGRTLSSGGSGGTTSGSGSNSWNSGSSRFDSSPQWVPPAPSADDWQVLQEQRRQKAAQRAAEEQLVNDLNRQIQAKQQAKQRVSAQATQSARQTAQQARAPFAGQCVGLSDGDTIQVLRQRRPMRVRLHGIDCPEKAQPFGDKARQFTANLVFGKTVKIYPTDTDRYGRTVAWVFANTKCVNRELVAAGLAWHYQQYAPRETKLAALQEEARGARRGFWATAAPVAPWDWRHGARAAAPLPTLAPVANRPAEATVANLPTASEDTRRRKTDFPWSVVLPAALLVGTGWGLLKIMGRRH